MLLSILRACGPLSINLQLIADWCQLKALSCAKTFEMFPNEGSSAIFSQQEVLKRNLVTRVNRVVAHF